MVEYAEVNYRMSALKRRMRKGEGPNGEGSVLPLPF